MTPNHCKKFEVNLKINDKTIGHDVGKSKKRAEQDAAKNALDFLKNENNNLI